MRRKSLLRLLSALCALTLIAAACGDDSSDGADGPTPEDTTPEDTTPEDTTPEDTTPDDTTPEDTTPDQPVDGLLPDNGPCDESLDPVVLAIHATFESPVLTLSAQRDAAFAAVDGFNSRGGVGGRCLELEPCNDGGDPNQATDCARQVVDSAAVASVNDTSSAGDAAVAEIYTAAAFPRIGQSPGTPDLNAPNSFNLSGGGLGTTFMMIPPLIEAGHTEIAAIHVDLPAFQGAIALIEGIIDANGGELVATIPVPAGTTNYDQFVLAAENAGATGVMLPLGDAESEQVLGAAAGLGTELEFSVSLGTFGQAAVAELGDLASQMYFNGATPPITAIDQFPALAVMQADFDASGFSELASDEVKASSMSSWMAVYAFVTVMSETDTADITRESVTAAFEAATDVDMLGIMPPWTPNQASGPAFTRISNPAYYFSGWDGEDFVSPDAPNGDLIATLEPTGLVTP